MNIKWMLVLAVMSMLLLNSLYVFAEDTAASDEFLDSVEGSKSCLSIALTAMMSDKKVRIYLGNLSEIGGYAPFWDSIEIAKQENLQEEIQ